MVETFISQMCDQFHLKSDYAKFYDGPTERLSSKLSAMALLNWINFQNGIKLSQIKHALGFY
jgi:hypothetical protein